MNNYLLIYHDYKFGSQAGGFTKWKFTNLFLKDWDLQKIAKCAFDVSLVLIVIWFSCLSCPFYLSKNQTKALFPFGERFWRAV